MHTSNNRYDLMQHIPLKVNVVLLVIIALIISWNHYQHYQFYKTSQLDSMSQSVANASSDLINHLNYTRTNIEDFITNEIELISEIINSSVSGQSVLKKTFDEKFIHQFPQSVGYILLDNEGHFQNYGISLGTRDISILDINDSSNKNTLPLVTISSQEGVDYYSTYARFKDHQGQEIIIGIGYKTELLEPILTDHQQVNLELLLWRHNIPGFIELETDNSKISLNREYYLDNDDMQRVGAIKLVEGTEWDVVSLYAPSLFIDKQIELIKSALIQLAVFALLLFLSIFYINSHLKQRYLSSKIIAEKEQRLSLALESTRDGVWEFDLIAQKVNFEESWLSMVKPAFSSTTKAISIDAWLKLIHPDDVAKTQDLLITGLDRTTTYFENEHRLLTGDKQWIWVLDRGQVLERDNEGNPTKLIGTTTNITSRKNIEKTVLENEAAFSEFYQIISSSTLELQEQVSKLLTLGCNHLHMKCGIVSFVEGARYTVLHVNTLSDKYNIKVGDVFDFDITYCQFTMQRNRVIGFSHAAESEFSKHPSYRELKLEAYLGAPIIVNSKPFGTLNFTSIEPRANEFTESEKYFVRVMSDWISGKLEKQHAEKAQQAIDQKLAFHIENSPFAVIEWTPDLRVVKWSQRAEQVLGWDVNQVSNTPISKWPLLSSEQKFLLDHLESSLASQDDGNNMFAQEMVTASGNVIHTEWFVTQLLDNDHQVIGLQSVVLDVSKRVHAEQALIRNQAKLADLYENAPDMYFSIDRHGNITSANQVSYSTLGYLENKLMGMPYWNLLDPADVRKTKQHIDRIFDDCVNEFELEVKIRKVDGSMIKTHQKLRLTLNENNKPEELRILCRDVTELAKTQEDRLQHIQVQRDEISREVQHRIKNSLQAVVGLLKINLDTYPELEEVLVTSIGQVNTIAIVNDLMIGEKNNAKSISVQRLLESIVEASTKLFSKNVNVVIENTEINDIVLWDEETIAISLVISELMTNAMKHSEVAYDDNNTYVHVTLSLCNDQKLKIAISNQVVDQEKLHFINNKDAWSGAGLALMESLLPPKGAELFFDKHGNSVTTGLYLHAPVILEAPILPLVSSGEF